MKSSEALRLARQLIAAHMEEYVCFALNWFEYEFIPQVIVDLRAMFHGYKSVDIWLTALTCALRKIDNDHIEVLATSSLGEPYSSKLNSDYDNPDFDHEGEVP